MPASDRPLRPIDIAARLGVPTLKCDWCGSRHIPATGDTVWSVRERDRDNEPMHTKGYFCTAPCAEGEAYRRAVELDPYDSVRFGHTFEIVAAELESDREDPRWIPSGPRSSRWRIANQPRDPRMVPHSTT